MKIDFKKIILSSLITSFVMILGVSQAEAQSYNDDDSSQNICPISIAIESEKKELTSWDTPVNVKVTVKRSPNPAKPSTPCSTRDTVTATVRMGTTNSADKVKDYNNLVFDTNTSQSETGVFTVNFKDFDIKDPVNSLTLTGFLEIERMWQLYQTPEAPVYRKTYFEKGNFFNITVNNGKPIVTPAPTAAPGADPIPGDPTTGGGGSSNSNTVTAPSVPIPTISNPSGVSNLSALISKLIRILLTIIAMAAVIMIIISGFRMIASNGSPTNLQSAKNGLIWAIIGLVVALLSFSVISIVQRVLS